MERYCSLLIVLCYLVYVINGKDLFKQNGDDLVLSCKIDSTNSITWKVNDEPRMQTRSSASATSNNSTLEVGNLTIADAGKYECMDDDAIIDTFNVSIVTISGMNSSVLDNSSYAELTCSVSVTDHDVVGYNWTRNGEIVEDSEENNYNVTHEDDSISLVINNPSKNDSGLYICVVSIQLDDKTELFEKAFSVNTRPEVTKIKEVRSKVEGETATIECKVSGFPTPQITWYRQLEDSDSMEVVTYDTRVNTSASSTSNISDTILVIRELKIKTDRGDYTCVATNLLGSDNSTVTLKVKDKLAAVWPFLGICAEVLILCSIIFIFEKRRNRQMEEEEEVDAVKQDLMNQSNGTDDKEVRQRNNTTKA